MDGDGVTLSDVDKAKLDGIVSQMTTNKESDANIQAVVNDFKTKYGQQSTDIQKKSPDQTATTSSSPTTATGSTDVSGQQQQPSGQNTPSLPDINQMPKEVEQDPINPRIGKYLTDQSYYVTNNRTTGKPVVKQWDAANNQFNTITDPDIVAKATGKTETPPTQVPNVNIEGDLTQPAKNPPEIDKLLLQQKGLAIYDKGDEIDNKLAATTHVTTSLAQQLQVQKYFELKDLYDQQKDPEAKEALAKGMDEIAASPLKYEEQNTPVDKSVPTSVTSVTPPIIEGLKTVGDALNVLNDQTDEGKSLIQEKVDRQKELKAVNDDYQTLQQSDPRSFLYNAAQAIQHHGEALNMATQLATGSDDEVNAILERNYKLQSIFPDPEPDGWIPYVTGGGKLGQMIGGGTASVIPVLTATAGGTIASGGNPLGGAITGAVYAAQDMARMQYADGMQQQYNQLRAQNPNMPTDQVYAQAKSYAKNTAAVAGATGLAMGSFGAAPIAQVETQTANQLIKGVLADVTKRAIADYGIGAGGQITNNYLADKFGAKTSLLDGANKQGGLMVAQSLLIGMLTHAYPTVSKYMTAKNIEDAKNSLALSDPSQLEQMYGSIAQNGGDKDEIQKLQTDVDQRKLALATMPNGLSDEKKLELLPLVQRKMQLIQQMATKIFPEQAAKSEIEKIDRTLNEEAEVPLTQKEHERFWDLKNQAREDGKLSLLERAELNHLDKRRDANYNKQRAENLKRVNFEQEQLPLVSSEDDRLSLPDKTKYLTKEGDNYVPHVKGSKNEQPIGAVDTGKEAPTKVGEVTIDGHGEDKLTAEGKENGTEKTNPLTETGKKEAENQAVVVVKNNPKVKTILHGTVDRTEETAQIVAKKASELTGHEVTTQLQPLLDTWNIGTDEGKADGTFDEQKWADTPDKAPDGGESWNDFASRGKQAWEFLKKQSSDTHAIVSSKMERMLSSLNETNGDVDKAKAVYFDKLEKEKKAPPPIEDNTDALTTDGGKTAGISHAAMNTTAEDLGITPIERGKVNSTEGSIDLGRELLSKGADPQKVIDDYNNTHAISTEGISIARAYIERLTKEANAAYEKYGDGTPEDIAAADKLSEYQQQAKPMLTTWGEIGRATQGATDIDTGTFVGLRAAYKEETGKDFTPEQAVEAKAKVAEIQKLNSEIEALKKKLDEANTAEETTAPKRISGKDLIAEGLSDLAQALGATKQFAATSNPTIKTAVTKIARGLLDEGLATAENLWDKVKEQVNTKFGQGLPDEYKEDALAALKKNEQPDIHTRFVNKTDSKFTPDEVKAIWGYAKENYIDQGKDFRDMISGVATDLSLTPEQVRDAITQPKGARKLTDEMYIKQGQRDRAINSAKEWVKTADQKNDSPVRKFARLLSSVPDALFALKTFGHGTVGFGTHAGPDAFQPSLWKIYFKDLFSGFKNAYGNTADYEKRMADLVRDPVYPLAKRSGLAVDPLKRYDDYQRPNPIGVIGKAFDWVNKTGDRGFNALKVYRLDKFKQLYNGLSDAEKADPNSAKELAKIINHSTGTSDFAITNKTAQKVVSSGIFAPRLEASRWARLIVEPAKAFSTLTNWNNSTPAEQAAAKITVKSNAERLVTISALLAANAGLLALSGSKQKINVTDPTQPDFLKFKGGDKTFDYSAGMTSTLGFVSRMLYTAVEPKKQLKNESRMDKLSSTVGAYVRGKLSPFATVLADFATHTDFDKNVLPPYAEKPSKGKHRMTWSEYALKTGSPIPVSEAIKTTEKTLEDKGLGKDHTTDILTGILSAGISGLFGLKIGNEPAKKK